MKHPLYTTIGVMVSFTFLFLLLSSANAAYNDVTLTNATKITANGITVDVFGSSAAIESITVNSGNFTVDLLENSEISIQSSDKKKLETNAATQFINEDVCSSTESRLTLAKFTSGSVTVTITPKSDTCGGGSATSSSGGGGGGGGGGSSSSSVSTPAPTVPPAQTPAVTQPQSSTLVTSSFSFTQTLKSGMIHESVRDLQKLLNALGFRIAEEGPGSPGQETNYYGALTIEAVQKFQSARGIVSDGTPATTGYGLVGPKTREALNLAASGQEAGTSASPSTPSPSSASSESSAPVSALFERTLRPGENSADVGRLQELLNSDPDTRVAESGPGSPGEETTYYGALTKEAVEKFQAKYSIVSEGTPQTTGYGLVGPKTQAKLSEVFGE